MPVLMRREDLEEENCAPSCFATQMVGKRHDEGQPKRTTKKGKEVDRTTKLKKVKKGKKGRRLSRINRRDKNREKN